jgi:hypothetical protein
MNKNQSSNSSATSTTISPLNSPNPFINLPYQQKKYIAIFDWDDTLMCTNYLETFSINYSDIFKFNKKLEQINPFLLKELSSLEINIIELFKKLIEKNIKIFIISNAKKIWINNCLKSFFVNLKEFINENNIEIYSTKNLSIKNEKNSYFNYNKNINSKIMCFKDIILKNYKENYLELNILSVGDSKDEKIASFYLKQLKTYYENVNVNFIKFIHLPSAKCISLQLKFIINNCDKLINNKNNNIFKMKIAVENNNNIIIKCIEKEIKNNNILNKENKNFLGKKIRKNSYNKKNG